MDTPDPRPQNLPHAPYLPHAAQRPPSYPAELSSEPPTDDPGAIEYASWLRLLRQRIE